MYWLFRITLNELMAYQLWMFSVAGLTYISMAWSLRKFGVGHLLAAPVGWPSHSDCRESINSCTNNCCRPCTVRRQSTSHGASSMPRLTSLVGLLACTFLQLLASIYLGWFLAFGLATLFMSCLLFDGEARIRIAEFVVNRWRSLAACLGVAVVAHLPILFPYSVANGGFRRHFSEVTMMLPTPCFCDFSHSGQLVGECAACCRWTIRSRTSQLHGCGATDTSSFESRLVMAVVQLASASLSPLPALRERGRG